MKRFFAQWRLYIFILLIVTIYTAIFVSDYSMIQPVQFAALRTAALAGVEALLNKAALPDGFSGKTVIRATTVSSASYVFFIKQHAPGWGRTLVSKRSNIALGFFFPAMVLLMFFCFYQRARTSSESEPDPAF